MTDYGIQIVSDNDTLLLDGSGILQSWADSVADNLDATNPVILRMYLPPNTISVIECAMSFQTGKFRSYILETADSEIQFLSGENSHGHAWGVYHVSSVTWEKTYPYIERYTSYYPGSGPYNHRHRFRMTCIDPSMSNHRHEIGGESSVGGTHVHSPEAHDHGLVPGINLCPTNPGAMTVSFRKGAGAWQAVGHSGGNANLLPLLNQADLPGWYELRFVSDRLSRVTVSTFVQAMMGID